MAIEHGRTNRTDFDLNYKFSILAVTDPGNLRFKEEFFIKKLSTLRPFGLNQISSIDI